MKNGGIALGTEQESRIIFNQIAGSLSLHSLSRVRYNPVPFVEYVLQSSFIVVVSALLFLRCCVVISALLYL